MADKVINVYEIHLCIWLVIPREISICFVVLFCFCLSSFSYEFQEKQTINRRSIMYEVRLFCFLYNKWIYIPESPRI